MTLWAHTTDCDTQNAARRARGELTDCICGGPQNILQAVGLAPPDGTREGMGVWQGGKWHPDLPGSAGGGPGYADLPVNPMWRTHHEPGSPEERYSRTMRFDKYRAMQALLMDIANHEGLLNATGIDYKARASEILAGMVRPRGPAERAAARARDLEILMLAYKLASGIFTPPVQGLTSDARALIVEALKAWEREHPPAPIDPLLGP